VCNTTNTLGGVGLYYWSANSAKWVKVNLPPTSAADSGNVLMSNGTTAIWAKKTPVNSGYYYSAYGNSNLGEVTLFKTMDTIIKIPPMNNSFVNLYVNYNDLCYAATTINSIGIAGSSDNGSYIRYWFPNSVDTTGIHVRCYRPSV